MATPLCLFVLRSVDIDTIVRTAAKGVESTKAGVGLVVAQCNASPFFQTLDTVLDEMPFVYLDVVGDGCLAIPL